MCLISVCPKGTKKYSDEVIQFIKVGVSSNRDGSGFMFKRDGESLINVKKGYKSAKELLDAIKEANLNDNDELVIHHRIGTSGKKIATNNHPFVVSRDHETIININCITDKPCLVHNGVFWGLDRYEELNPDFSDTYAFVRYVMSNTLELLNNDKHLFEKVFSDILGYNKVCLLMPNKDLIMLGKFVEENGYYHSHSGFKDYSYRDVGGRQESAGFTTAGGTKTGTHQLKLPMNTSSNSKLPVMLTGELIDINSFNYNHFLFVPKDERDNDIMTFEEYDDESITNLLKKRHNEHHSISLGVSNVTLKTRYTYHPYPKFDRYYKEYLSLLLNLNPSKNVFKDIYRVLTNPSMKKEPLNKLITIKNCTVSKLALLNYYFSLVDSYMADDSYYANYKVSDLVSTGTPLEAPIIQLNKEVVIMD